MSEIQNLAYVVIAASDLDAWSVYASDILGMAVVFHDERGLALGLDDHPWRLFIQPGSADDIVAAGWNLGSDAALDSFVERLRSKGTKVVEVDPEPRSVSRLYGVLDPSGFTHEFFAARIGLDARASKVSPVVRGAGFVTGDLGLGHILTVVPDYDAGRQWYEDVLGLRYSDRIKQEIAPGIEADATFYHSETGRHHSLATAAFPYPKKLHHLMLEYADMSDVGAAFDRARTAKVPISMELGHHPNDQVFSFYMQSPSGFNVELGHGGVVIDDATWEPKVYDVMSDWGHRPGKLESAA